MQRRESYIHMIKDQSKALSRMLDDFDPTAKFYNFKQCEGIPLQMPKLMFC